MYESKQNGRNQTRVRSLIEADDRQLSQLVAQKRFSRWLVQNKVFDIQIISRALLETPSERLRDGIRWPNCSGSSPPRRSTKSARRQHSTGARFGRCAISLGHLTEDQLATLLAIQAEPPNLLARTLTTMGLLDKAHAGRSADAIPRLAFRRANRPPWPSFDRRRPFGVKRWRNDHRPRSPSTRMAEMNGRINRLYSRRQKLLAYAVHAYTATGLLCGALDRGGHRPAAIIAGRSSG